MPSLLLVIMVNLVFSTLESRAEAHKAVAVDDVVAVEVAVVEARVPSVARIVLRRRPVVVRKALV